MTTGSMRSILLRIAMAATLPLFFGCHAGTKRGPEHISGTQFTLLSGDMNIMSVPDTIETVAIDSVGMYSGKEFQFTAKPMSSGLVLMPLKFSDRVHDLEKEPLTSVRGRDGVVTSTVPLRYYEQAPCKSALLIEPGTYTVRLKVTESSAIWEINMDPWVAGKGNIGGDSVEVGGNGRVDSATTYPGSYSTGDAVPGPMTEEKK